MKKMVNDFLDIAENHMTATFCLAFLTYACIMIYAFYG